MRLTIGRLAERAGVHRETIRYYEREGLVPQPGRTPGGHRIYGEPDVERLQFIRRARELGFTLSEVRQLIDLSGEQQQCREVRQVAELHLDEVRQKIRDLKSLETALRDLTRRCRNTPDSKCPIVEALRFGRS